MKFDVFWNTTGHSRNLLTFINTCYFYINLKDNSPNLKIDAVVCSETLFSKLRYNSRIPIFHNCPCKNLKFQKECY